MQMSVIEKKYGVFSSLSVIAATGYNTHFHLLERVTIEYNID